MPKIYSPIKQRVIEFLGKQGIKKEKFFSITKIARPNFYGANAKSELGGDKIIKILEAYPKLNPVWLLTGKGDMLCFDAHMERENWITSDEKFYSANHSHEELLRVGARIDEVCWQYGTSYKALSKSVGISLSKLEKIIAGKQPAPKELLEKIAQQFPGLDLGWLFCGLGRMFTKEPWSRDPVQEALDRDIELHKEHLKIEQKVEEWLFEQKWKEEWKEEEKRQQKQLEEYEISLAAKEKKQRKPTTTTQKKPTAPK
jgi:hypothetical protein